MDNNKHNLQFIAFYLPQYHRIKENDEWWGEGFTEWTNTRKAVSLFPEQRQPRIPLNDNYYDLTDVRTLQWQADLMKKYHVHGLCFYHYWFDGKLLLEKPMELLLQHKEIDMNFCISWANEPWTRHWDGGGKDVLMPQNYGGPKDWEKHFNYLLPFFQDERYIKIDNKPLVAIYLPSQMENSDAMVNYWRQLAKENGFDGIFLAETLNAKRSTSSMESSDACIEFEPNLTLFGGYFPSEGYYFYKTLHVFWFDQVWSKILERKSMYGNREKFCGAFVDWDNSSRVGMRGSVCIGSTPESFEKHLGDLAKKCIAEGNDRFIFINAWNEWAEGAYLEPDKDNEYRYLESVKRVYENIKNYF